MRLKTQYEKDARREDKSRVRIGSKGSWGRRHLARVVVAVNGKPREFVLHATKGWRSARV